MLWIKHCHVVVSEFHKIIYIFALVWQAILIQGSTQFYIDTAPDIITIACAIGVINCLNAWQPVGKV